MQQTEKYQLNLIDPADELSPEPLNANARKVDAVLARVDGSAVRMVVGSYAGNDEHGEDHPVRLDFADTLGRAPKVLLIIDHSTLITVFEGMTYRTYTAGPYSEYTLSITWTDTGLSWWHKDYPSAMLNVKGTTYYYIALA